MFRFWMFHLLSVAPKGCIAEDEASLLQQHRPAVHISNRTAPLDEIGGALSVVEEEGGSNRMAPLDEIGGALSMVEEEGGSNRTARGGAFSMVEEAGGEPCVRPRLFSNGDRVCIVNRGAYVMKFAVTHYWKANQGGFHKGTTQWYDSPSKGKLKVRQQGCVSLGGVVSTNPRNGLEIPPLEGDEFVIHQDVSWGRDHDLYFKVRYKPRSGAPTFTCCGTTLGPWCTQFKDFTGQDAWGDKTGLACSKCKEACPANNMEFMTCKCLDWYHIKGKC